MTNALKPLHRILVEEIGKRNIERTEIPPEITRNLSRALSLRPYQVRALQMYLTYWDEEFDGKPRQGHQLLFHMATGSGKTLIMASIILDLYRRGYRNFIFFVNSSAIIDKTRENFLNPTSRKYLFSNSVEMDGEQLAIREVTNFQRATLDTINIVFTTIQGLHTAIKAPREGGLSIDDFESQKVVLISDEAHHINVDTKRGVAPTQEELFERESWESSVNRVKEMNPENVLLEFTATVDFADEALSQKYLPLLIFDYSLREFRKDLYSKEVRVLQADLPAMDRSLQAILLSQYRQKLFGRNKINIKPVVMFKSKTIKDSKQAISDFAEMINTLTGDRLVSIQAKTDDKLFEKMFGFYRSQGITLDNLVSELKSDFSQDKTLEVNSKEDSEEKQITVNTLEDEDNPYRAIFAVDKLNEGWDVLNLFDIVRLYDTRDSKAGKVGKTTMSEAQLIGRGARYCPFAVSPGQVRDKRKYDSDVENDLRICEELTYHSAYNPKYLQELNKALTEIGISAKETRQRPMSLKRGFKEGRFFKEGLIFLNRRLQVNELTPVEIALISEKLYKARLHTGRSASSAIFDSTETSAIEQHESVIRLKDISFHITRTALQKIDFFRFENLAEILPGLKSWRQLVCDDDYLGGMNIQVSGLSEGLSLNADDALAVSLSALSEVAEKLSKDRSIYAGSKDFKPHRIADVFRDKVLSFSLDEGEDKEFGRSMTTPQESPYHLDLSKRPWYAYNDCFGTSEEKAFIKFIDGFYAGLKKKWAEVYLLRNERFFQIYDFLEGRPMEPDFVLFLGSVQPDESVCYQVFIEPKGGHLMKQDEWKEQFLISLQDSALVEQLWSGRKYNVWGLPFFNQEQTIGVFSKALESI